MEDIPILAKENFNEILDRIDFQDTKRLFPVLKDMVDYAPFASRITSEFISEAIYYNHSIEDMIRKILLETSPDGDVMLSRCIYATYLGGKTNIPSIDPVSDVFSSLTLKSSEIEKFGSIENFYCHSIIKQLRCCKRECVLRLCSLPYECTIEHILKNQSLENISIIVQMSRFDGFLEALEKRISEFKMKKEIVALIFINCFSNPYIKLNEDADNDNGDKAILKRLITGDTLLYCLNVCNRTQLGNLLGIKFEEPELPCISSAEFSSRKFDDITDFLRAFVELTSPSVTHFLSYLEFYKDRFRLNKDNEKFFVDLLKTFHKNNAAYLQIVLEKLQKFGINTE